MEYSIKQVAKKLEISEQAIYKRIKNNYEDYSTKVYITTTQVEQPNGTTKEQIFITDSGLEFLLQAQRLRKNETIEQQTQVEQPTQQELNNYSPKVEQPTAPKEAEASSNAASLSQLNLVNEVLNQTIQDLKAENKRLNEKLDSQEQKFDAKMEQQKQEHKEEMQKQREEYQKMLDLITSKFNMVLQRLPQPQEDTQEQQAQAEPSEVITTTADATITEAATTEDARQHQGLFSRLFRRKAKE